MCRDVDAVKEITMLPIRKFNFDAGNNIFRYFDNIRNFEYRSKNLFLQKDLQLKIKIY